MEDSTLAHRPAPLVRQPHGGALLRGGLPGNSGGKPGRSGRRSIPGGLAIKQVREQVGRRALDELRRRLETTPEAIPLDELLHAIQVTAPAPREGNVSLSGSIPRPVVIGLVPVPLPEG